MQKPNEHVLAQSRHFSLLDSASIQKLIDASQISEFARGQLVFSKTDAPDAVFVVLKGEISIEILSPDGRIVRVATLRTGDVFGELAVLDGGERTADARVVAAARLLKIHKRLYHGLISEHPQFCFAVLSDLIQKLRKTDGQIEDISFRSLKTRLAFLLLDLAGEANQSPPSINITQSELADRLSATREKVNVHLQSIQSTGAIALSRGRITFLDLDRLAAFAEGG